MRIAIISPWNPWPVDSGSRQRADLIIRGLAQRHDVFVIYGLQNPVHGIPALKYAPPDVTQFQTFRWPRGETTIDVPRKTTVDIRPRDIQRMQAFIPELVGPLNTFNPDVILALEADGALIATSQTSTDTFPLVIDQWEPSRIVESRILTRLRSVMFWHKVMRHATAITVVTDEEKLAGEKVVGAGSKFHVVANEASRIAGYVRQPAGRSILFVGNLDYQPNRDGILWFIAHVLPTIQKEMSGVQLEIVGNGAALCPDGLPMGVTQRGWVDNISASYSNACIAINPVRSGHGSRVKNQCAIVHAVPLVTFPDGITVPSSAGVQYIHDDASAASAFAAACVSLLKSPPDIPLPSCNQASETTLVRSLEALLLQTKEMRS